MSEEYVSPLKAAVVGVTFSDLLLLPGYSEVVPADVDVSTSIGGIKMGIPLLSAAMDTVTEKELAAELARAGGLGILHKNLSIDERADHIEWVKRRESGVIYNPVTLNPEAKVGEAKYLMWEKNISGIPIVDEDNNLLGMLTKRDVRHATDMDEQVKFRMTERDELVTLECKEGCSPAEYSSEARKLMDSGRVEKIPIVRGMKLEGLITEADIEKVELFPDACRDRHGRLRVGVAISNNDFEIEGVAQLIEAGADMICVDSAHGHSKGIIDATAKVKKRYGDRCKLISGNVGTYDGAKALLDAGADIIKGGIGPGSICTTRIVSGCGVPHITAMDEIRRAIHDSGTDAGSIADGGVEYSGDLTKLLKISDAVMLGGLLAGCTESPGKVEVIKGLEYKIYRGMGSMEAMVEAKGSRERYMQGDVEAEKLVPEGVKKEIPHIGPLRKQVFMLIGGLRSGCGYVGAANLQELKEKGRYIMVSPGAVAEAHPHGVALGATAVNYR